MVNKVFEKLVNNRLLVQLEKYSFLSDFHYGFRSTADSLTVASDRIAWAFNRPRAPQDVTLDISKAFGRVWHTDFLRKLKSYGLSGQILSLIWSFFSKRQLQVVLDGKLSQECPVNTGVPPSPILGATLFLLYINDLPDYIIYNITIYADILVSTLSVIRHLICGSKKI